MVAWTKRVVMKLERSEQICFRIGFDKTCWETGWRWNRRIIEDDAKGIFRVRLFTKKTLVLVSKKDKIIWKKKKKKKMLTSMVNYLSHRMVFILNWVESGTESWIWEHGSVFSKPLLFSWSSQLLPLWFLVVLQRLPHRLEIIDQLMAIGKIPVQLMKKKHWIFGEWVNGKGGCYMVAAPLEFTLVDYHMVQFFEAYWEILKMSPYRASGLTFLTFIQCAAHRTSHALAETDPTFPWGWVMRMVNLVLRFFKVS